MKHANQKEEIIMAKRRRHLKRSVKAGMFMIMAMVFMIGAMLVPDINANAAYISDEGEIDRPEFEKVSVEKFGIDVSEWNGVINWDLVRDSEVNYAIIRCGFGINEQIYDDIRWTYNADECTRLGIPFGVYIYSYATSVENAKSEAEHVLRQIEGYHLSYPIYFDMEDECQERLSAEELGQIAKTFCDTISDAGYDVGIYSNTYWYTNVLTDPVFNEYDKWCAQYNDVCEYQGEYHMWQYSSTGVVPGIDSNVDLNVSYEEEFRIKE